MTTKLLRRGGIRGNLKLVSYIRAVQKWRIPLSKVENSFVKGKHLSFGRFLFDKLVSIFFVFVKRMDFKGVTGVCPRHDNHGQREK